MYKRLRVRRSFVALLIGVLVGGGLLVVTPAGAEVSTAAATNWKKIWKKNLQPQADKRYYTKRMSNQRYATKSALADFWTKGEADARYQPKGDYAAAGSSYSKAESDAKYAPYPALIRGQYAMEDSAGPFELVSPISFGVTLSAIPTARFIATGAPVPAGCSGTAAAPNASPGYLCIFESTSTNVGTRGIFNSTPFGAVAYINPTTSGSTVWSVGSWAVRPASLGTPPAPAAAGKAGGTNGSASQSKGSTASGSD